MNIFDILGPVMVGPSSSHTAGAVRIGLVVRKLLMEVPVKATITLSGSFAETGVGHGTDRALVAGLLGMEPDDTRIPLSFDISKEEGLTFEIKNKNIRNAHPNTALLVVQSASGKSIEVQASSIGGGRIMINRIADTEVNVTGECPVLIIRNVDQPGYVAKVTSILSFSSINIASLNLHRNKRGGSAVMVIETDSYITDECLSILNHITGILNVTCLNL